jgi:hypothetical protein
VLLSGQFGRLWPSRPAGDAELYCKITASNDRYASAICHVELSPSGDHLAAVTTNGAVYALHFSRRVSPPADRPPRDAAAAAADRLPMEQPCSNRYVLLDTTRSRGTAATFAGRLPKQLFVGFKVGAPAAAPQLEPAPASRIRPRRLPPPPPHLRPVQLGPCPPPPSLPSSSSLQDATVVCYDLHSSTRVASLPGHRR